MSLFDRLTIAAEAVTSARSERSNSTTCRVTNPETPALIHSTFTPSESLRTLVAPAILWMVASQLMFTAMNIFSRLGGRGLPWSEVAGARFLFGALVTVLIARSKGSSLRIVDRKNTWLRSLFGTLASFCFFYSVTSSRIPLGDAITLQSNIAVRNEPFTPPPPAV